MLPAILTTLLWSTSSIFAARSAKIVGGSAANLTRMLIAATLLGLWAHTAGAGGLGGPALPWFLFSGFLGFGVGDVAMFGALQRIGPRLTMLMTHCLAAPLAAFTEWAWLGTKMQGSELICAGVILAGVGLALAPDHSETSRKTFWIGVLCGVGSACGQGFGSVLSIRAQRAAAEIGQHVDGATAAYQRILAGIIVAFIFFVFFRKRDTPLQPGAWRKAMPWIIANALAGPSIGVAVYQWGLATLPAGRLMSVVATAPVLTQFLAWAIDGVPPTRRTILGGIVAVAGVIALRQLTTG